MLIETPRLIIRDYKASDSTEALEFLGDKETMHYLPEESFTIESIKEFIAKNNRKVAYYPIVLKEEKKVIGHLYFEPFFGDHSYEIGWVFNQAYQGNGYAFEAAQALMDWGFKEKGIHRVIATCQPENSSSYKLMEKLGMRREGYFKECIPVADGWWDEYYYAILKSEW
ncbi:GNAT family N-acetyltransferase [Vagococcus coleopterorum]|uniref:GNAT family N-acetyltransferase n=1 Tax=Vagococcus coleopterorum TaxID=2714946 RepID=A0A6G8AN85_9ENTE|nr:GNAT family protein [Vagococcus coleopterorum]QIL46457.1 GNAT family N-acetyltransferase [Vagococcus coleopterorum]